MDEKQLEELYEKLVFHLLQKNECGEDEEKIWLENSKSYLQNALKFSKEKHDQLFNRVISREAPRLVLNVNVVEASYLKPQGLFVKSVLIELLDVARCFIRSQWTSRSFCNALSKKIS